MLSLQFACQNFLNQFFTIFFSVPNTRYLKFLNFLLVACFLYLVPLHSHAAQVSLGWQKPVGPVVGYLIHYGSNKAFYEHSVDVGNSTSCTISGLQEGVTYYFSVTAYNDFVESDYAIELVYTVPYDDVDP